MEDPLAKFRKEKPAPIPLATLTGQEPKGSCLLEPYIALHTKDKNRGSRLDMRVRSGLSHAVLYQHLYEIVYDRKSYETVYLIYNSLSATLEGYNLRAVVDAVRLGSAEAITEWDETAYERPLDKSAPFIEKLTIISAAEIRAKKAAQGE